MLWSIYKIGCLPLPEVWGFFCDLQCEDLVELLEVKLSKV